MPLFEPSAAQIGQMLNPAIPNQNSQRLVGARLSHIQKPG
jgi:hypothetical protein